MKRVYVHESIYAQFRDKIVAYTRSLKVNTDDDAFMGPLQNKSQYDRVHGFLSEIKQERYQVALCQSEPHKSGYFINPTIVENPPDESRIVQEEPFGMSFNRVFQQQGCELERNMWNNQFDHLQVQFSLSSHGRLKKKSSAAQIATKWD